MTHNHFDDMRYYFNLSGYTEKFEFTDNESEWINGNEKLPVFVNFEQLAISKHYNFLVKKSIYGLI